MFCSCWKCLQDVPIFLSNSWSTLEYLSTRFLDQINNINQHQIYMYQPDQQYQPTSDIYVSTRSNPSTGIRYICINQINNINQHQINIVINKINQHQINMYQQDQPTSDKYVSTRSTTLTNIRYICINQINNINQNQIYMYQPDQQYKKYHHQPRSAIRQLNQIIC